jgi:preprotein translocase subunit SecB
MAKTAKPAPKAPAKKAAAKSTNNGNGSGVTMTAPAAATVAPGAQPSFKILGQYLKDFSFENPNAPQSLGAQQQQPDINIAVNVNAKNLGPNDYEVELQLDAKAMAGGKVIFAAELIYAGLFRLENFPPNLVQAAALIDCFLSHARSWLMRRGMVAFRL